MLPVCDSTVWIKEKKDSYKRFILLCPTTIATLEQILQVVSVREEILRSRSELENNDHLHDLLDGRVFKNHQFFKSNPRALQIIAYYDEVETCNPLGSSSGKYKLGCIFFTLGNIRPLYRSGLKAIFLLAIAKSPTIKLNGIDCILKPFINDLKILCDKGITIEFNGKKEIWKGVLLAFLADNLAAHELGGFKESFSFAKQFCRSCLADKEQSQKYFREDQFNVRTPEVHADQCSQLNGANSMAMSTEYGINRQSLLDDLPYFSVVNNMPHDVMHDMLEGVIPYELKLVIQNFISKSYFSLETLNHRLKAFDFGYSEIGDKPAPIDAESKLRQSASQMWLLAKIFPLIIGDLVPRNDTNWECFLKLLKICEICTAPVLSENSAAYIEILIEEHHSMFQKVYNMSIIPKMHFMVHYSRQILDYGPLIHTWTMRHEAKLRVIKRAARISNFKNVCQTVTKRHQHLLCYYMHKTKFLSKLTKIGPCKPHSITVHPESVQSLLLKHQVTENSVFYTTSFVTYNGITFKPDVFILYSLDAIEPIFCKIITIIKTENDILFLLNEFVTNYCDEHFHAFCISENSEKVQYVSNIKNLCYNNFIFHARQTFAKDNKLYLTYKYIESS